MDKVIICLYLFVTTTLAISLQDFIFPEPKIAGDRPFSLELSFIDGIPTVPFAIGTPAQQFTGIFDTGSPFTWVASDECNEDSCKKIPKNQKFHRNASSTNVLLGSTINYDYLDGTHVQLRPELDTVTLGNVIQFPRHPITEALKIQYPRGSTPSANARIGVGAFSTKLLQDFGTPDAVKGLGHLRRAAGDDHYATGYSSSGSPKFRRRAPDQANYFLWVLGSDSTMYQGKLYELPLAINVGLDSPFWKVQVFGFELQGKETNAKLSGDASGTISSSTPYLMLPASVSKSLNEAIGAHYSPSSGLYVIDCAAQKDAPPLTIQLNGVDAVIPPDQYINTYDQQPQGQTEQCFSTIVDGPDPTNVQLGGPFFRSFYLEYRLTAQQVAVAESIANLGKLVPREQGKGDSNKPPLPKAPVDAPKAPTLP